MRKKAKEKLAELKFCYKGQFFIPLNPELKLIEKQFLLAKI